MKLLKITGLSVLLVSSATIVAIAQDQTSPTYPTPPQVATNPGLPYSYALQPGPKVGPSTWIPSEPSATNAPASAGARNDQGSFYSKKGFGPAPN
jgi:hypothetical protein